MTDDLLRNGQRKLETVTEPKEKENDNDDDMTKSPGSEREGSPYKNLPRIRDPRTLVFRRFPSVHSTPSSRMDQQHVPRHDFLRLVPRRRPLRHCLHP